MSKKTAEEFEPVREAISIAVIDRAASFEMKRKDGEKMARNFFLGGAKAAEAMGALELSSYLKDAYLILVERGMGFVYKWAGIAEPVEPEKEKQAA